MDCTVQTGTTMKTVTGKQAKTAEGKLRSAIAYPKAFKGEKTVAKPLKEKPTYGKSFIFPTRH